MGSPQEKAGSTMDGKGEMPHLLPVSLTVAKKATTASRPSLFPDAVRLVGIWAVCTACLFLGSFTLSRALDNQCVQGDEWIWMMCAASQAAAAVLALLLPCRHRQVNRALAYLALAATIIGHYMLVTSGVSLVLALNPERYLIYLFVKTCCIVTMVFLAAGDLVSFLALGGDD